MKKKGKRLLRRGIFLIGLFAVWTVLVCTVDMATVAQTGTAIGFAGLNGWFHELTGVHMWIYTATDWLSIIPFMVCVFFGAMGCVQLIRRRSLLKVDMDLILLGVYYVLVILAYLAFEKIPVNYRPVLIEGRLEASYPSSTTLLVLSVMPTLVFQAGRRLRAAGAKSAVRALSAAFCVFMAGGRLISGVHWLTDIVGGVLLSAGLFCVYKGCVYLFCRKPARRRAK